MHSATILTSLLPLLAAASPLTKRAGAPSITPIPKDCTVVNPLPHANCGNSNVDGYEPNPTFVNNHLLYSAYFPAPLPAPQEAKQCAEQCYGYGMSGQCKSSFLAYSVPVPQGYEGSVGGQLETTCLLFDQYLDPLKFVASPANQYVNATAANIYCPQPRA